MAIEFYCPGCGKLMRTPDPTAGRKGRCPHCATKVQIPMTSMTTGGDTPSTPGGAPVQSQSPQPRQPAATQPLPQPAADAPIQFVCGSCHKTLRVPAANAGKKGKCPHCATVMTIPTQSPVAGPAAGAKWKGAPQPAAAAAAAPIQFTCPGCRKSVRVKASAAGQQGQCPHCQTVVKIPLKTAAKPRPAAAGLTPLAGSGGLTPLGGGGLTPLDGTQGLTPLGNSGGLTPLGGPDPFAGAADPFGGLTELSAPGGFASQDPFGGAASYHAAAANPYASPAPTPSYASRSSKTRSRGKRSGLPWDNKNRDPAPFTGTMKLVLFSPAEAFSLMQRSGGSASPMLFCIYGSLIGGAFAIFYRLVWDIIFTLPLLMRQQDGAQAGAYFVGMIFGLIIGVVVGLVFLVIFTLIAVYVGGGIFHLCLMMLGGANHGFETTVRVVQYTYGATALSALIPVVGPLVQLIANIVILSIGLSNAHETSGVKATFAVLIPYILCIASGIGLVIMLIAMIAAMAANAG